MMKCWNIINDNITISSLVHAIIIPEFKDKSMKELTFIKANKKHLDAIVELEHAIFPILWTKSQVAGCFGRYKQVWLAQQGEEIVGVLFLLIVAGVCEILNIGLVPKCQGQGIGDVLMNKVVEMASKQNCEEIFLEVRLSNKNAQRFYQKHEFDIINLRKNYYTTKNGGREDAIIMQRRLK